MNIQLSEHFDYRKLIKFTLPTIIMMIFTSIYGVVDGIFVSNYVGSDSFAAINLIMPILMILSSVGFMLGTGGSALVSKTLGEQNGNEAKSYFSMLTYLLIIIGIVFTVIGIIFIKPISMMLGAKGAMLNDCVIYGRIIILAIVPFLLENYFQSFLVVAEKPKMGLAISIFAGIANMVLDFLFIYVFKWSIFGAALATGISQVIGGIIPLIYFIRKNDTPLQLIKTKFDSTIIFRTCANGSSEMLTHISLSIVNILYNAQLMKFAQANGVVAYGIIMYVNFIFIGTYIGYALGVAPIIGYHFGANNTDELKNILKRSLKLILIASIILTLLSEIFANKLASIFVSYDNYLLRLTTNAIRIFCLSNLLSGFNIFTSSFFTALNNGKLSALVSFLRTLVFQVINILILPMIFGLNGIWFAIVLAEILSIIVSIILIWKNRKIYHYL